MEWNYHINRDYSTSERDQDETAYEDVDHDDTVSINSVGDYETYDDVEKLYDFTFKCPLNDLNYILDIKRNVRKLRRAPTILETQHKNEFDYQAGDDRERIAISDDAIERTLSENENDVTFKTDEYLIESESDNNVFAEADYYKDELILDTKLEITEEIIDEGHEDLLEENPETFDLNDNTDISPNQSEDEECDYKVNRILTKDEQNERTLKKRSQSNEDEDIYNSANEEVSTDEQEYDNDNNLVDKHDITNANSGDDFDQNHDEEDDEISAINNVIRRAFSEDDDAKIYIYEDNKYENNDDTQSIEMNAPSEAETGSGSDVEEIVTTETNTGDLQSYSNEEVQEEQEEEHENDSDRELLDEKNTELFNRRALLSDQKTYDLEKFERNAVIIFSQQNLNDYDEIRVGTETDVNALKETFENVGFEVEVHNDLCKDDTLAELKRFSETDFTEFGCVAVAVLTSAWQGCLRAQDDTFSEHELFNFFNTHDNPALISKPKFFIIQASSGSKTDEESDQLFDPARTPYSIEPDTLILRSTGNCSYGDEDQGSWFIQTFCNCINKLASSLDLESILTEVKREFATEKFSTDRCEEVDTGVNRQMPVVTSTLIRKLFLRKFGDTDDGVEESDIENTCNENKVICPCALSTFYYFRECIRHFVDENPEDELAACYLEVAETLQDSDYNEAKGKITKAISNYLKKNATEQEYYKYIYFPEDS